MFQFIKDLYHLTPTVTYCEKPIGHFIQRPFYAISDLAFIVVGLFILLTARKSSLSKVFGLTTIVVGLFLLVYDATYSYLFQLLDVTGMYILVTLFMFLNLKRMKLNIAGIYRWLLIIFSILIFYFLKGEAGNIIFGLFVIFVIASEWLIKEKISRKDWAIGVVLFVLGFIVWLPDATRTLCDPSNIFNGRGIFHLFEATAIYYLYKFYSKSYLITREK